MNVQQEHNPYYSAEAAVADPLAGQAASAESFQAEYSATDDSPEHVSGRKINRGELADVTAQLAIMTRSGVDITTALKSLARQCKRPALATVLNQVHDAVVGGTTFSGALKQYEHIFGPTYVATVSAGEATGKMSHVLQQLSHLQRSELRMSRTIKSLLAYPVLLTAVSSLVILSLILFVLPQFAKIFDQYNTPLPALTQVLIGIANELRVRWWIWCPVFAAMIAGAAALRWSESGRRLWDQLVVSSPLLRDVSRMLMVGRSCRLLGLMIESGVPLLEALRLVRKATNNSLYKDLFWHLEDEVMNGRGLTTALQESSIVPPSAAEMIATSEQAGNLGEVTRLIGEHFEEEGEAKLRQCVAVLEPIITVGMGLIVAVVVLAVMLPMFDLATFANG